jgi:hypothetical protein
MPVNNYSFELFQSLVPAVTDRLMNSEVEVWMISIVKIFFVINIMFIKQIL